MLVKNTLAALLGLAVIAEAATVHTHRSPLGGLVRRQNKNKGQGNQAKGKGNQAIRMRATQGNQNAGNNQASQANNKDASVTCLAADALQTGSESTGQSGAVAADGQSSHSRKLYPRKHSRGVYVALKSVC